MTMVTVTRPFMSLNDIQSQRSDSSNGQPQRKWIDQMALIVTERVEDSGRRRRETEREKERKEGRKIWTDRYKTE